MANFVLRVLLLICVAYTVLANRRVVLPNPSNCFHINWRLIYLKVTPKKNAVVHFRFSISVLRWKKGVQRRKVLSNNASHMQTDDMSRWFHHGIWRVSDSSSWLLVCLFCFLTNQVEHVTISISCGTVLVPEGYKNIPDLTKRYPDCCINIIKLEQNGTKIENTTKIETNTTKVNVNVTQLATNATKIDDNVIKISDDQNKINN